jgi:hypothetical protein
MTPLLDLLVLGTFVVWIVAVLLLRAARQFPDIRSLRERAVAAAVIATFGTVYLAAATSVDLGGFWDQDTSRVMARISFLAIELIPGMYWLWLYASGFKGKAR